MEEHKMHETPQSIPYIAHESEVSRLERINKRFFALVLVLAVMLFVSNGIWIWYESQFEDEVITVESNTDSGGTAIANATGEVYFNGNGESDGQETHT